MKILLIALLLFVPSMAWTDSALYPHCLQGWSAQTLGEVCFAWAEEQGLPRYGEPEEQTAVRAFALCGDYFAHYLSAQPEGVGRAIVCQVFTGQGPSVLVGW
jgi:hypothetical protein